MNSDTSKPDIEERRLSLDQKKFELDNSFARKWLPTLATVMVGLIATFFGFVQQRMAVESTERTRIEAKSKDEREWGFKVVQMYFDKREFFDLNNNAEQATANLRVLAAVAPTAVQGLLNAEQAKIPPPSGSGDDTQRLQSLSAVADVQNAIASAKENKINTNLQPTNFTVYIQYPDGSRESAVKAQAALQVMGFKVPGLEQVQKAPSRLQIRYYRSEQQAFAGKLAVDLGTSLGFPTKVDNAILVVSAKQLPTGIMEVWLPQTEGR